ncbi:hypothetical protein, partial [Sphingomonas sp.]|uniref:hypothetical protein n=1 Tax=Sphingomonas sp. TaxID=28214 RepID=UPI003D6C7510
ALGKIDRENVNVSHVLLLLQRTVAPVRHHTMPGEGGIHPISSGCTASDVNKPPLSLASPEHRGGVMVYGLNIVPADKFLYAAEPLDGDVSAIRAVNQEPDGGVGFKGCASGRQCHTDCFPTRMLWKGPPESKIGDFNRQNLLNVSEKAKALIEKWEPRIHQFVPVDFVNRKGALLEKRYCFVSPTGSTASTEDRRRLSC